MNHLISRGLGWLFRGYSRCRVLIERLQWRLRNFIYKLRRGSIDPAEYLRRPLYIKGLSRHRRRWEPVDPLTEAANKALQRMIDKAEKMRQ